MKKQTKTDSSFEPKPSALLIFEKRIDSVSHSEAGEFSELLSAALRKSFGAAPVVSTSEEIWEALFNEIPAVIIIELTMRSIDALGFIRSLRSSRFCCDIRYFICCPTVNDSIKSICTLNEIDGAFSFDDDIESTAEEIYSRYLEMKPSSADRRLISLAQMMSNSSYLSDHRTVWELGSRITDALLSPLGFNINHKGTKYLEFLICLRVFGAEMDMSKLYAHVAECCFTTPGAVEKAVRYAIECAWSGSSPYMQYRMFGNSVDPDRGKPTASEFVETIVRHTIERLCGTIDYNDF